MYQDFQMKGLCKMAKLLRPHLGSYTAIATVEELTLLKYYLEGQIWVFNPPRALTVTRVVNPRPLR